MTEKEPPQRGGSFSVIVIDVLMLCISVAYVGEGGDAAQ